MRISSRKLKWEITYLKKEPNACPWQSRMSWIILHSIVTGFLEAIHPFHHLFQLVTYDNLFVILLVLPAPFQASLFFLIHSLEYVLQYSQFVCACKVDIELVFVV